MYKFFLVIISIVIFSFFQRCKSAKDIKEEETTVIEKTIPENSMDYTRTLNQALASANGEEVVLAEGVYFIEPDRLIFPTKTDIKIVGEGKVVLQAKNFKNFCTVRTQSVTLENIEFRDFKRVVEIEATKALDVKLENCTIAGKFTHGIYNGKKSLSPFNLNVNNCVFQGNEGIDMPSSRSRGGIWLDGQYNEVSITNTVITSIHSDRATRGIGITSNDAVGSKVTIEGNTIKDITGAQSQEVQGIMAFGDQTLIANNVIENITANTLPSDDCEGIYTKSRQTIIKNNILKNAGNSEGAIVVKGTSLQGEPSTRIEGNVITDTRSMKSRTQCNGIVVRTPENTEIINNRIVGVSNRGIEIEGSKIYKTKNILIRGNHIENIGKDGIKLISNCVGGGDVEIKENSISNIGNKGKTSYVVYIGTGLREIGELDDVIIENNATKNNTKLTQNILVFRRNDRHIIDNIQIKNNEFPSDKKTIILDDLKNKSKKSKIQMNKINGNFYKINLSK